MAIEFKVNAVLGDTSKLKEQLKNLKSNVQVEVDGTKATNSINKIKSNINKMYDNIKVSDISKRLGLKEFDSLDQRVQQLANDMAKITNVTTTTDGAGNITGAIITYKDNLQNTVSETLKWKTTNSQVVNGVNVDNQKLVVSQMKYTDAIEKTENAIQKEQISLRKLGTNTGISVNTQSISNIETLNNALKTSKLQWSGNSSNISQFKQKIDNAGNAITTFTLREKSIKNGVEQWKKTSYAISEVDGQLRRVGQTQEDVINSQMSLTKMVGSAIERFGAWGLAMKIWTSAGQAISNCVSYITDLDKAMTNIQMVTMDTKEATSDLFETYNQMGQELGRTTLDVSDSAEAWLRQGHTIQDSNELVKDSMMLSTLGQVESADATDYLTSAMKGYKTEVSDVSQIVDKLVSVDLIAATSAGDLAVAMSKTANMARTSGVEMDKLLAILATTQEVTQSAPEQVGNTWKTIFSRMSNIKLGKLEDSDSGEALNDVETVLNSIGIQLRDNNSEWRNFGDVLDEVGKKWQQGTFSDTEKSALSTAFAGTRQKENFLVLMENYDNVEKYATQAFNSAGTAEEKYAIYTESVAGKQATLNAKFEEFYNNILNSDFIKKLIDIASGLMNIANAGNGLVGGIGIAVISFGLLNIALGLLVPKLQLGFLNVMKFTAGLFSATTAVGTFTGATGLLVNVLTLLSMHPIIATFIALAGAVGIAVGLFDALTVSAKEQKQKFDEATKAYDEAKKSLSDINTELQTTKSRITELEGKDKLTFVEKEELQNLREQNALLEKRQRLAEIEAETKQKEADKEAEKLWDKGQKSDGKNTDSEIKGRLYVYQDIQNEIDKLAKKEDNWTDKDKKKYDNLVKNQEKYKQKLLNDSKFISENFIDKLEEGNPTRVLAEGIQEDILSTLDPEYLTNKFKESIKNLSNELKTNFSGGKNAGVFKNLKDAFTVDGKFDSSAYENFNEILKELKISAKDATDYINTLKGSCSIDIDVTPLKSYSQILSEVKDPTVSLVNAQKEMNDSGYLTFDTVEKLGKQFGNLDKYLTLTNDGYTISKEGLDALNGSVITQYELALNEANTSAQNIINEEALKAEKYDTTTMSIKEQLKAMMELAKANLDTATTNYEALGIGMNGLSSFGEYKKATQQLQSYKDALQSIENSEENLKRAKATSNMASKSALASGKKSGTSQSTDELKELKETIESLEHPAKIVDKEISALGNIDTIDEMNRQYTLMSQKLQIVGGNISAVQNKLNNKNLTQKQREYLEDKLYEYKADIASIKDSLDKIRLDKLQKQLDDMQKPIDNIEDKIKRLGDIDTIGEKAQQSDLLAQKFRLVSDNISKVNKLLSDTSLSKDMRDLLNKELQDLVVTQVSMKDDIKDNIKDAVELEKDNAQLEAELNYKEQLYKLETQLYGLQGKEAYEHMTDQEIDNLQSLIDAREAEKSAEEDITKEQEYQNSLLEAKLKLQNALNNKTVKVLTKQDDGSWQYEYSANMNDVKEAQDGLKDIEKEYDDWKYDRKTDEIQKEIDAIQKESDEKSKMYDDMEFQLSQSLEAQTNSIEEYYSDINRITQERMDEYQKNYGNSWDKVISIAQNKLQKMSDLNTQLQGQSEYAFETVGTDGTYVKKVQSFDVGGTINGSGLALVHDKERVLTDKQNSYFESFISKIPQLLSIFDITKFSGLAGNTFGNKKNVNSDVSSTKIDKVECVFPNITSTNGLQEAILQLPRLALQSK